MPRPRWLTEPRTTGVRAGAIIAAAAVLDNIVPSSIASFILATATNLPVGPLLVGGLFAGLALAAVLAVAIHLTADAAERTCTAQGVAAELAPCGARNAGRQN